MKEAFEKIKERMRDKMNHSFNQRYKAFVESIEIVNQVEGEDKDKYVSIGAYKQVAWERDIAIKQLHDLGYEFGQKIDSNDVIVSNLAKAYALNIKRCGVDITGKLETATQNAAALNQAYLRGRKDERDKFDKWREKYGKDTNVRSKEMYEISLEGYDDYTFFEMEMTKEEYEFLLKVAEKATETSIYGCMPRMYVEPKGE